MSRKARLESSAMLKAAVLFSRGHPKYRIAEMLGVSPSAVSKLVKRAMAEGLLRVVFQGEIPEDEVAALEARVSPADLKHRLGQAAQERGSPVPAPEVRVFSSGSEATTEADWTARLEHFTKAAAGHLEGLILRSEVCGISWGETLASVVRALEDAVQQRGAAPGSRRGKPKQFIPLCGEALGRAPSKVSASALAYRLDEIINGDPAHKHSLWLAGVPARLPEIRDGFSAEEISAIDKYIHHVGAYREVFGAPRSHAKRTVQPARKVHTPWVNRLDTVLTSVGPAERPLGHAGAELLRSTGLSISRVRRLIRGDIAGILIKKADLRDGDSSLIDHVNEQWNGINEASLRRCAQASAQTGKPGVVVVAIGRNKAASVLEIVTMGLVNQLVIDHDLAGALDGRLRSTDQPSRSSSSSDARSSARSE